MRASERIGMEEDVGNVEDGEAIHADPVSHRRSILAPEDNIVSITATRPRAGAGRADPACMAGFYGKATGVSRGRGGSTALRRMRATWCWARCVSATFRDVVQRARAGTLRNSELSDPKITVTSLGEQGAETVFPVIYPPQVAIVGFAGSCSGRG